MTSNIGSQHIQELRGAAEDERDEMRAGGCTEALRRAFRPEFLNRVDETVIFHASGASDLRQIVDIQLGRCSSGSPSARSRSAHRRREDLLAEVGYDPTYGARPLKRAIQRAGLDPLSRGILGGQFREGDTVLATWRRAPRR